MDKIEKILRIIPSKEKEAMLLLMEQIKKDFREIPGVRALQGMKGWHRVRMGSYRIIFAIHAETKEAEIMRITRRNERTYKSLK